MVAEELTMKRTTGESGRAAHDRRRRKACSTPAAHCMTHDERTAAESIAALEATNTAESASAMEAATAVKATTAAMETATAATVKTTTTATATATAASAREGIHRRKRNECRCSGNADHECPEHGFLPMQGKPHEPQHRAQASISRRQRFR